MIRITAATRVSLALACVTLSVLLAAQTLGLFPDAERAVLEGRKSLCEAVAIQCCLAAQHDDLAAMRTAVESLARRNPSVLSAAVRRTTGELLVAVGDHRTRWLQEEGQLSSHAQVRVPIFDGRRPWGSFEVCFEPLASSSFWGWLQSPTVRLVLFVTAAAFLAYVAYMKRTLKHLDPSSVIPDRVRTTLDTLAEGVLVLDKDERIVLANKAFAENTGRTVEELQGRKATNIEFAPAGDQEQAGELPWAAAIREGVSQTGVVLGLDGREGRRTFVVNSTPILGGDGRRRGALATFDDVTSIEKQNEQLQEMLDTLRESREEIRRQNEELTLLATRDPLTGCLNRRAFYSQFDPLWSAALKFDEPLACVMVDIDHFKNVNDTHGHAVGDQVLQHVAGILRSSVRPDDVVCRFGGEEFCIVLPRTDVAEGVALAERLRNQVATTPCAGLGVTASLGLSARSFQPADQRELLDQADKSLYASKRGGRNRVTLWADLPPDFKVEKAVPRGAPAADHERDVAIPFHAVSVLMSALAYRDARTAEHSRRVADLCVATARGLMTERQCYILEVAALLHDIGKLGVPDAILLKPGQLTPDEWKVMSTHDRIGVEIISAAFASPELTEIVRTHHAVFGGAGRDSSLPRGTDIPLGARILTIADAYDAMVSDRVYRKGRSPAEAFVELRKFGGTQFDPDLVERFIGAVTADDRSRTSLSQSVSKQTALRIGLQVERLASALDAKDFPNLAAMAGRLAATAQRDGVDEIATLAQQLESAAGKDPDLLTIVELTTDLLEVCRATRQSFIDTAVNSESGASPV